MMFHDIPNNAVAMILAPAAERALVMLSKGNKAARKAAAPSVLAILRRSIVIVESMSSEKAGQATEQDKAMAQTVSEKASKEL